MTIKTDECKEHHIDGEALCYLSYCRKCGKRFDVPVGCHDPEHAQLTAEVDVLREQIHKADGMANEINILTKENRQQAADLRERDELLRKAAARMTQMEKQIGHPWYGPIEPTVKAVKEGR